MRIASLTLGLLAVMVVFACAPIPASAPSPTSATENPPLGAGSVRSTEAPAPAKSEPTVVVTPRGNALQATDPSTVNLAGGQPQLVEFFRFT